MEKETLLGLIKEQRDVVKRAQKQLDSLLDLASDMGMDVQGAGMAQEHSSIADKVKSEIGKKRREIMEQVRRMRQDAMDQMEQMKTEFNAIETGAPGMAGVGGFGAAPGAAGWEGRLAGLVPAATKHPKGA